MSGDHVTAPPRAVPVPGPVAAPVAGLYGKLPARGDFIERRLSDDFVDRWDRFLAEGLRASEAMLGPDFTDRYLVSPFWRFALAPGIAGDGAVAGVFAPSVDRAGRYFPLTVAVDYGAGVAALAALTAAEGWTPFAEQLIFDALSPDGTFEALDDGVASLAVTPPVTVTTVPGSGRMVATASLAEALVALAPPESPSVLFWTLGSVDLPPRLISFGELPPAAGFAGFLDGVWEGERI